MNKVRFRFEGKSHDSDERTDWQGLSRLSLEAFDDPKGYHTNDEGLVAAVNTALTLGMPLLLTGPAGVGKTQLAYRIAYELNCRTIFFPVKSTTEAQGLFYEIDQLRRLHAAQANRDHPPDIRDYLQFQGLGLAILRTMAIDQLERRQLVKHAWPESEQGQPGYRQLQPSVVLIDEIDKAPPDFPNDVLEELRRCWFRIPEMPEGQQEFSISPQAQTPTEAEKMMRPIVVATSNSEKALPDAFLRRCVYYHMHPPGEPALNEIVARRLGATSTLSEQVRQTSISLYLHLTGEHGGRLTKKPSTAELLSWLLAMEGEGMSDEGLMNNNTDAWKDLAQSCLLKLEQDQAQWPSLMASWPGNPQQNKG